MAIHSEYPLDTERLGLMVELFKILRAILFHNFILWRIILFDLNWKISVPFVSGSVRPIKKGEDIYGYHLPEEYSNR